MNRWCGQRDHDCLYASADLFNRRIVSELIELVPEVEILQEFKFELIDSNFSADAVVGFLIEDPHKKLKTDYHSKIHELIFGKEENVLPVDL